jgi:hypothetical protein
MLLLENARWQRYQELTQVALWVSNFDVYPNNINQHLTVNVICTITIAQLGQQHY